MVRIVISNLLGCVGAAVGAVVGFYIFEWFLKHGYLGLMIPGAFLGLGCSLFAQHRSVLRGVVCAVVAFFFALFCEWKLLPFRADNSFSYFIRHLPDLGGPAWLMIVVGAAIGGWIGGDSGIRLLRGESPRRPVHSSDDRLE